MTGRTMPVPEDSAGLDAQVRAAFGFTRLLVVGTGSVSVSELPFWLGWLRFSLPGLDVRVVVTRSAERFVTRTALAMRTDHEVLPDTWPEEECGNQPLHVELAEWAEAVVVYPATLNFMARLALGMSDTPVMTACQCTTAPIVLAPMLPPGGLDGAAYARHRAELESRRNVAIATPATARQGTTEQARSVIPPLLDVLKTANDLHRAASGTPDAQADTPPGPGPGTDGLAAKWIAV